MTREKAEQIVLDQLSPWMPEDRAQRWVNLFVGLGMLKLDEPKIAGVELFDIIRRHTSAEQARCITNGIVNAKIEGIYK